MKLTIQSNEDAHEIVPAKDYLPPWFKHLPAEVTVPGHDGQDVLVRTAKACSPLTDAFTMGYLILLRKDVLAKHLDGRTTFENEGSPLVSYHQPHQAPGLPEICKWDIGSGIILPEGHSAVWTHPLSRVELPFITLSAIIDDGYNSPGLIPFVWNGREGRTVVKAGTPIAQILPFQRQDWEHDRIKVDKTELYASINKAFSAKRGYRKFFHKVKRYV